MSNLRFVNLTGTNTPCTDLGPANTAAVLNSDLLDVGLELALGSARNIQAIPAFVAGNTAHSHSVTRVSRFSTNFATPCHWMSPYTTFIGKPIIKRKRIITRSDNMSRIFPII